MRPQLAVSAGIFRNDQVLLIRRGREPARGLWTFPGGRVEFGETLEQAVTREISEETSLSIEVVSLAGWREMVPPPEQAARGHFVVMSFAARWTGGEVVLNEELEEFAWIDPGDVTRYPRTEGLEIIMASARRIIGV